MTSADLPDPHFTLGEDGTPRSAVSDDVYFSIDGGIDETRHVFIDGIGGPQSWPKERRVRIGELGFGTGLNFLVTWHDWIRIAPAEATLEFVSVEGFPIMRKDLHAVLSPLALDLPEIAELLDAYPVRVAGYHRLIFAGGRVRLTLMYGDVSGMLREMRGGVDAWYLDGFSPAKNARMWDPETLKMVAKATMPGGRLATFSAAGAVRRSLSEFGFEVSKRAGFGRKRECVAAYKVGRKPQGNVRRAAVIGAGIAGACASMALGARGVDVTIFDGGDDLAASGNPAALLAPRLPREQTLMGQVMARCYLFAVPFYDRLSKQGVSVWHGARGAFAMARDEREEDRQRRAKSAFGLPDDVMRLVDVAEARELTGTDVSRPGLWFAGAGTLNPRGIVDYLQSVLEVRRETVDRLVPVDNQLELRHDAEGSLGCFDTVVLACGVGILRLLPQGDWPIRPNRGQISYVTTTHSNLRAPITFGGYLTPKIDLGDGRLGHVLGATYARRDEIPDQDWDRLRDDDTRKMGESLLENINGVAVVGEHGGRTALRATVRDYLPMVGGVAPGLFMLGGLGSRGFMTAPLMAELLADEIVGNVAPLEAALADAVSPRRFR